MTSHRAPRRVHFGEELDDKHPLTAHPEGPHPKPRMNWRKLLWLTPIFNMVAGISLLTSSFLPDRKKPETPAPVISAVSTNTGLKSPQGSPAPVGPTQADVTDANKKLADLKDILRQLGWTMVSVSTVLGTANGITMGYVFKQPSMVLSSLTTMGIAPMLMVDPSIPLRAAIGFFATFWLSGYANRLRNQYHLKPGEAPRAYDMAPMIKPSALKAIIEAKGQSPTKTAQMKEWFRQFGGAAKFIVDDMGIIMSSNAKRLKWLVTKPGEVKISAQQTFKEMTHLIKHPNDPATIDKLKPNPVNNQVGAMLFFVGNIPMLFLGGGIPEVTDACMKISAMGSLCGNMSLAMMGIHEKEKMLLVGIPLATLGSAWGQTDAGTGVGRIGLAGVSNFSRKQVDLAQAEENAKRKATPAPTSQPIPMPQPEKPPQPDKLPLADKTKA